MVKKGGLTIYSPDLLATEQELLEMLRTSGSSDRLMDSAKRRLKLWNVSDEDIDQLLKTRKASEFLTLRSPFDGIAQNVSVKPGMSVKVGDRLIGLVDLSVVWLWAEFYENELPLSRPENQDHVLTLGMRNSAAIAVIEPFLDPMKRTVRVRVDIPNPQKLCPGMLSRLPTRRVRTDRARQRDHVLAGAHRLRGQGEGLLSCAIDLGGSS
jgi:Cu(I)/Ag(I) efflux system membrane fusion protein